MTPPTVSPAALLDGSMVILRDVMSSYDWRYLVDVRDELFVARLDEALKLVGLELSASAKQTSAEGGLYTCESEVMIYMTGAKEVHRVSFTASSPSAAMLMAMREAFAAAGLVAPLKPVRAAGEQLLLGVHR